MLELGFNYRLSDLQCALGTSQLAKLDGWLARRRAIAARYREAFVGLPLAPLAERPGATHAYHLFVVQLDLGALDLPRGTVFQALRAEGIGVNVHYLPVYLHPYYQARFGSRPGRCPVAEAAYARLLSLPLFPGMTDEDAGDVIRAVEKVLTAYVARRQV
jgi:perosamine synthetase